ncbi:Nn.00g003330.m01.CDS01 [Neocucurbitaria sp. VM-36]
MSSVQGQAQSKGFVGLSKECLRELYRTGHFADVIIKHRGLEIRAHALVLRAVFPESNNTLLLQSVVKATDYIIGLADVPLESQDDVITAIIGYCYTQDYEEHIRMPLYSDSRLGSDIEQTIALHAMVLHCARKNNLSGLTQYALDRGLEVHSAELQASQDNEKAIQTIRIHYNGANQKNETAQQLVRYSTLQEYRRRMEVLISEGNYEIAVKYITVIPEAAVDLLSQTSFHKGRFKTSNVSLEPTKVWECTHCHAKVRHTAKDLLTPSSIICHVCGIKDGEKSSQKPNILWGERARTQKRKYVEDTSDFLSD